MSASYLAITPARDEEALLPGLIASMRAQTIKPLRWIVINDGSTDRTREILDRAAHEANWIEPYHLPADRPRRPGGEAVIMQYLRPQLWRSADFVFRMDADLSFDAGMIESLITEFSHDPRLGIASPTLAEMVDGEWEDVVLRSMHTRGATKMYSRACFEAIGELEAGLGWDVIDEARAAMTGFATRNFRHIRCYHHRPQGSAGGLLRGRYTLGQSAYYVGYSPLYLFARVTRQLIQRPYLIGSTMMLAGYLEGYLRRRPMVKDRELIKFIRKQQVRRLMLMDSLWS